MILLYESMSCLKRQKLNKQKTGEFSGFFMTLLSLRLQTIFTVKAHEMYEQMSNKKIIIIIQ